MKDNKKKQQPQAVKLSFRHTNALIQYYLLNKQRKNQNKTNTNISF